MSKEEQKKQRESHVKSLRLLRLEKAIQSIAYPSVERLMKELEVSRRTILRDLEELKIFYNAPIEYDRMRRAAGNIVLGFAFWVGCEDFESAGAEEDV